MSFITDAFSWLTGGSLGSRLIKTALTGFALNRITASINRDNETKLAETGSTSNTLDLGTRVSIDPNTDANIPIVYGVANMGGIITDAYLSSDQLTMTVVYTISEKTGSVFSTGDANVAELVAVTVNDALLSFEADGVTVKDALTPDQTVTDNLAGLIKVYFYDGNSESPRAHRGYESAQGNLPAAYDLIDAWNSTYMMEDLVFAVCKITYNKDKRLTGLPDFKFGINNNVYRVGDVLYDYMTNTRYGGGIPAGEIYQS
jgi:hypothetical protein